MRKTDTSLTAVILEVNKNYSVSLIFVATFLGMTVQRACYWITESLSFSSEKGSVCVNFPSGEKLSKYPTELNMSVSLIPGLCYRFTRREKH